MKQAWRQKLGRFVHRHVRPFAFMVLVLCTFRSSVADWNDVPTGSMNPTILEGDRIFVNKLAYDLKVPFTTWHLATWGEPGRGDVVVFYAPDGTRMVKRVVGLPGDTVALRHNVLHVNGRAARYGPADPRVVAQMAGRPGGRYATESVAAGSEGDGAGTGAAAPHPVMTLPGVYSTKRSFGPVTVPAGRYFLMGDNRDNSLDSRYWGFVARDQIVGRASGVAMSLDPSRTYRPRWDRFLTALP